MRHAKRPPIPHGWTCPAHPRNPQHGAAWASCTCGVAAAIAEVKAAKRTGSPAARAAAKAQRERFEVMLLAQIAERGLPRPRTQFFWHPDRLFHADGAWPERALLYEVQGGIWRRGGGAHSHPTKILADIERQAEAAILGWRLVPVTTDDVKSRQAIVRVARAYMADPEEQAQQRRVAIEAERNRRNA